LNEFVVSREKP